MPVPLRLALLSLLLALACRPAAAQQPNIVMVLADDLGWTDLSAFGSVETRTPHLDQLAAEGLRFTDFYASAPVCSPSRASLLTGRFPLRVGLYSWVHTSHRMHLREEERTIAEVLQGAGYDTAHLGKWHLSYDLEAGSGPNPDPGDHGFDYWLATGNNANPSHHNPDNFVRNGVALGEVPGYSSHIVVDEALRWLDARQGRSQPFFLNLWFHEPHQRVAAPPELVARHADTDLPAYYGSIENMDLAVGRLVDHLKHLGLWENTLFVFTSDNGSYRAGSVGALRGRKTQLWEGGLRVPGVMRWPGHIAPGSVTETPAGLVDLFPTFVEAAGLELPTDRVLDGVSLVPLFEGAAITRGKPLYWFYSPSRPVSVIRAGDWALVADPDLDLPTDNLFDEAWIGQVKAARLVNFRLYNLRTDPQQQTDLAAEEPERFEQMKAEMTALHREVVAEAYDWRKP